MRQRQRQWGWQAYLGFGAALGAAYYLSPPTAAKLVIWPAIGISSAVAIVAGTHRYRPAIPQAWYLFALGQLTFVAGDTLYNIRTRMLHAGPVFPSVVDLCYLVTYPCLITGLLLLIRRRSPGRDVTSLIDATIITVGLGLLAWVFLIVPYVHAPELTLAQRLVAIAYPLGDVLLLAVAARLAVGAGQRPLAWWLLAGSVVPLLAADTAFGLLQLANNWQVGGPVDIGWILFYVCWGAAALHPSMAVLSHPAPTPTAARLSAGRLLLLAGAALIAPALLAVQDLVGKPVNAGVIAVGAAVLFLLVLARMGGLSGELAVQRERKRTSQTVLRVAEEERTRLAAELHDGPVQRLSSLLYKLGLARLDVKAGELDGADGLLGELETGLSVEIASLRRLMSQLRPPVLDQLGMARALGSQAEAFQDTSGVACTVHADPAATLTRERETVLYRVTQEALANVAKHAHAARVWVALEADNGLIRLRIRDDGTGFDMAAMTASGLVRPGHFGLASMRERVEMVGGRLHLDSGLGQGTTITVEMDVEWDRVQLDRQPLR